MQKQEKDRHRLEEHESLAGVIFSNLFSLLKIFLVCFVLVYLTANYLVRPLRVQGGSMYPTLKTGEFGFGNAFSGHFQEIKRGDIVIVYDKKKTHTYWVKRVIGLPGDTVACKGSGEPITVNGKPIDESAYLKSGVNPSDSPFSVTVTDGNVFVLGDNRSNSRDSRYHLDDGNNGLVPYDDIQGVALFRFWPFTRIGILN